MPKSNLYDILPPWSARIRPYPPGKPIEEVERELGRTAIKLASNENPLGPSPKAQEAIRKFVGHLHFYPDGSGYYLREKIAGIQGLSMDEVILGAGSTDLIELVAKTFLMAGDEAITSESAFYMYRLAIEDMGAGFVQVPMRDLTFDLAAIAHAVPNCIHAVPLTWPNRLKTSGAAITTMACTNWAPEYTRPMRGTCMRILCAKNALKNGWNAVTAALHQHRQNRNTRMNRLRG